MQDLHIVWYVDLMFANCLSSIYVSENRQDKNFIEFKEFSILEQQIIEKLMIFCKS